MALAAIRPGSPAAGAPPGATATPAASIQLVLGLALVFGLTTGLAEAAVVAFVRFGLGRFTHIPMQVIWMAPVDYVVLFGAVAALFLPAAWLRPDGRWLHALVALLAFLGVLSVLLHATGLHPLARLVLAAGVAARIAAVLPRFVRSRPRLMLRAAAGLGLVVALLGGGYNFARFGRERLALAGLPVARAGAPNVLLIIWDTVRARSLSLYGYARSTTPQLEQLGRQGIVFDEAISTAPWTLAAHAGMFTGRLPHTLGVGWRRPLDGRFPTLAEVLARNGYATAGFVGNTWYAARESGLARGMAHYEGYGFSPGDFLMRAALARWVLEQPWLRARLGYWEVPGHKTATRIREDLLRWLDHRPAQHPFFAFVNLFDAHEPYLPPAPFDTLFRTVAVERQPLQTMVWQLTPAQRSAEHDAYDASIAYLDAELGRLLHALSARGLLDNTLVIVTSDHGEEFGEHGVYQHGNSLYLPSLRVPLVMVWPRGLGTAPRRVASAVTMKELPATVMDLLGLPAGPFNGRSLARFWEPTVPDHLPGEAPIVSEVGGINAAPKWYPIHGGNMHSIVADGYHYIRHADGREEVYDLRVDPAERIDLARDGRWAPVVQRLREAPRATLAIAEDGR